MLGIAWCREESTTVKGSSWLYSILLFNKYETLGMLWEPWTLPPSHQWERLITASTQERTYEDWLSKIQRHWMPHPKWVFCTCWRFVLYCIVFQTVSSPNSNPYYYELHVQFGERQLKNSSEGPFTVLCRAGMLCGKMGWVMCLVFNI